MVALHLSQCAKALSWYFVVYTLYYFTTGERVINLEKVDYRLQVCIAKVVWLPPLSPNWGKKHALCHTQSGFAQIDPSGEQR